MQWELEKIYREQVKGNIPPRKHLKVLGEDVEEQADPDIDSLKDEIKRAVDSLSFDDNKEAKKLLAQIYNFPTYKNVKKTLGGKGYSPLIFKRFSADVQRLTEDIPPGSRDQFLAYLQSPEETLVFPTNIREAELSDLIGDKLDYRFVPPSKIVYPGLKGEKLNDSINNFAYNPGGDHGSNHSLTSYTREWLP